MAASKEVVLANGSDLGSETEDQQTTSSSSATVVSLLDRLRAPKPSDLARKRKVAVNPPRGKRSCKSMNVSTAATIITPRQRITELVLAHHWLSDYYCTQFQAELHDKLIGAQWANFGA